MKRIVVGVLAHVDAGKTTLTEAMLYASGKIDKLGRVDKKNSFLDTNTVERERGITVFSKQALFSLPSTEITLIDTPGHVDFAMEAERALSVQDYAILVVSAPEGPMAHTVTLWNLLKERRIPTFIFVNKMDIGGRGRRAILDELKRAFGSSVTDFCLQHEDNERFLEECASASEELMSSYFESGEIPDDLVSDAIARRRLFPCFFGSALSTDGVEALLRAVDRYTKEPFYSKTLFGARVYKIATDPSGAKLTYMKITGGDVKIKSVLKIKGKDGVIHEERVEQIRMYSADKFKLLKSAEPGMICAIPGLEHTYASMGLGTQSNDEVSLTPVLDYRMIFEKGTDVYKAYLDISPLGEEEPSLGLRYDDRLKEIRVRLMGPIQTEVLTRIINDRFGYAVSFDEGSILYKETVGRKSYGAGHFEPLMHYAEVRVRIEPLERGKGLVFTSNCPTDRLKSNWQRLILSILEGRRHKGVLTAAPLTDMQITLIAGRAHPKHTEGGDFREATCRALRQGLMKNECILLEPTFDFNSEIPAAMLGRFMTDVSNMHGSCQPAEFSEDGATAFIKGNAPVYTIRSYPTEIRAYTRGAGKITFTVGEYAPCHNAEQIIEERAYDPENDPRARADSIFCKNGSGYVVPWQEADALMHTENPEDDEEHTSDQEEEESYVPERAKASVYRGTAAEDKELMAIFERTYGKITQKKAPERVENKADESREKTRKKPPVKGDDYLIIDGYNFIFAHSYLAALAKEDLSHARDALTHLICNYHGYKKCKCIIVFDTYKRHGGEEHTESYGGVSVVYTKERQTADAYIEKAAYDLGPKHTVRVVSSDYEEQLVILGAGALRVSAREFIDELECVADEIKDIIS